MTIVSSMRRLSLGKGIETAPGSPHKDHVTSAHSRCSATEDESVSSASLLELKNGSTANSPPPLPKAERRRSCFGSTSAASGDNIGAEDVQPSRRQPRRSSFAGFESSSKELSLSHLENVLLSNKDALKKPSKARRRSFFGSSSDTHTLEEDDSIRSARSSSQRPPRRASLSNRSAARVTPDGSLDLSTLPAQEKPADDNSPAAQKSSAKAQRRRSLEAVSSELGNHEIAGPVVLYPVPASPCTKRQTSLGTISAGSSTQKDLDTEAPSTPSTPTKQRTSLMQFIRSPFVDSAPSTPTGNSENKEDPNPKRRGSMGSLMKACARLTPRSKRSSVRRSSASDDDMSLVSLSVRTDESAGDPRPETPTRRRRDTLVRPTVGDKEKSTSIIPRKFTSLPTRSRANIKAAKNDSSTLKAESSRTTEKSNDTKKVKTDDKDESSTSLPNGASVYEMVNRHRTKRDLKEFSRNMLMDTIAKSVASDLASSGGQKCTPTSYHGNVGQGDSVKSILKTMLVNKGTARDNLLSSRFTELGVGMARGKKDNMIYMCQLFK